MKSYELYRFTHPDGTAKEWAWCDLGNGQAEIRWGAADQLRQSQVKPGSYLLACKRSAGTTSSDTAIPATAIDVACICGPPVIRAFPSSLGQLRRRNSVVIVQRPVSLRLLYSRDFLGVTG